jgi:hypothetical protein
MRCCLPLLLLLAWFIPSGLCADGPAFDLTGPKVDVHVKRGDITLPIGEVPNLLPGDRLWIHPDFPESQSTHFVLIVVFLRGATNPPPPEWFTRVETWTHQVHDEGVFVTVPQEAQQAIIFLAPETGGDFSTLRNAVRGRPGAFVRATQDLQAASLDRMRLDAYLDDVKITSQTDLAALKERAEKSARTLGIRVDQQCFDKPSDQQAPCLVQHTDGLVLDDTNAQSLVAQLANGSTGDLMNQLSYSTMGGGGLYSPYVGAIVDTLKILSSLHTAHFQYIPALALPTEDTLNLRLNVPPSFRDPKSVVVVALPPVGASKPPPLHPVNPAESFCAQKPGLVLPAEGAPLVFGTQLAYGLNLHIDTKSGAADIPLKAESAQGGLVPAGPVPAGLALNLREGELTGEVRGKFGFDDWVGPRFHLHSEQSGKWTLSPGDQSALVVGRDDMLHFAGDSTLCVETVEKQAATGSPVKLTFKTPKPDTLEVSVPMQEAAPGPVTLQIWQFGEQKPDSVKVDAYAEAASLDRLTLSSGDPQATLKGNRLDEVASVTLDGVTWTPGELSRVEDFDLLGLKSSDSTAGLEPEKAYKAKVTLRDGRLLKVPVTVGTPRPEAELLSKGTQEEAPVPSPVRLGSLDDLPLDGRLVFFLKSREPQNFPRTEKVEVAAVDSSFHTVLSLADGGLMLEDAKTAIGTLDPLVRFGSSAFGPVEARVVSADGATGDWMPLGTLVRLPGFKDLRCPRSPAKPCVLTGTNLFLAASIGAAPDFDGATDVPPDFTGTQLTVPHPANGILYLRLRDDPPTVQTLALPVTPMTAAMANKPAFPPAAATVSAAQQTPAQPAASAAPPADPQSNTAAKPAP